MMGRITTVTLDDHAIEFLDAQVAAGRFASASDALTAAVRLLEERDHALEELRAEIQKGEDSGYREITDLDAFFETIMAERAK
jgi:antitoxin ParD1/3/4